MPPGIRIPVQTGVGYVLMGKLSVCPGDGMVAPAMQDQGGTRHLVQDVVGQRLVKIQDKALAGSLGGDHAMDVRDLLAR